MKHFLLTILLSVLLVTMIHSQAHYEVESNSSSSAPQLLLTETEDNDFVRLWFQNNAVDKWAFNAKPKAGTFDNANLLPSPIIFAYNGVQKLGIGSDGKVRINKAYRLPNVDGSNGQVLTTDGLGNTSWQTSSGGGSTLWQSNNNDINYTAGSVGIGTNSPDVHLEVDGAIKVGYENPTNPQEGTIRWNTTTKDFEGYDGSQWRSLMKCSVTGSSNAGIANVTPMCCDEYQIASDAATNSGQFGRGVAIHGNYAVVAAGGFGGWTIYIFEYDGANWSEILKTKGSSPGANNWFGSSVAIYDDWIAVGSSRQDDGKTYMFKNDGTGIWTENTILAPSNLTTEARFGHHISMYGDYMSISAPDTDIFDGFTTQPKQGKVYLYENINDTWTIIGEFDSNQQNSDTHYGSTVDITDQYMAVGSEVTSSNTGISEGRVYMYRKVNNLWSLDVVLGANFAIGDKFGSAVSLDNNTMVVSAESTEVNSMSNAGTVYIYEYNNGWNLTNTIVSQTASVFEKFGVSVDIKGDYILIGKRSDVDNVNDAGAAEVYHYNNGWTYNRTITDEFPEEDARFANNNQSDLFNKLVATDGVNLIIGAASADVNGFSNAGKVLFGPID